jgi:hypothetical protein
MFIEVLLQNNCGSLCINQFAAFVGNDRRGVAFINQRRDDTETSVQLIRKAPATQGHFMFDPVGMTRQADYAQRRLPLPDQFRDQGKLRIDDGQRLRLADRGIADGNPDALEAEIKAQHRLHLRRRPIQTLCMAGFAR